MIKTTLLLLIVLSTNFLFAQNRKPKPSAKDTLSSQVFINLVEQTLETYYQEYASQVNGNSVLDALEKEVSFPEFTDDEICKHLEKMNELSPYKLDCNSITLANIRFFQKNRRSFIKICLGRSKLYFDMYEEQLAKYDLPIDLRFLSVIESGLRPQVKSPAGALGLWQFMYGTGKMYGLKENSHFDERMDPLKATDAACRYLKKLFEIYGDWNLALAAYNAGPGNINKAIRRSGGKRTYWEVRPFLPRETQGYVPNFIAAAYLMTFYKEHKLVPAESSYHVVQLDTMCLKSGVHFETISSLIQWDVEEIKRLNPIFKKNYIPQTFPAQCISGPLSKIGKLVSFEDSLFKIEKQKYGTVEKATPTFVLPALVDSNATSSATNSEFIYHKVRKGETLAKIAKKYNVTPKEILDWNNLRTTKVPAGKVLKVIQNIVLESQKEAANSGKTNTTKLVQDSILGTIFYDTVVVIYHTVQRNETLESIANVYNVKLEELIRWNNLKDNILNINQRLIINSKIQLSRPGMVVKPKEIPVESTPKKEVVKVKPATYTVKSGDLFNRIAQKNGITVQQLQKLNPSVNPDRISVGQKLRIK